MDTTNTVVERDNTSWVVGIVIALLVLGLAIAYFSGAFGEGGTRDAAPTVDDRIEMPTVPNPTTPQ